MSYQRLRPTFTFDADRVAQLRAIAPEAFADGAINWEVLRAALGEHVEDESADAEHFGLFWPGKRAARRRASEPSRGTLIPVPGEGVNEETTRNIFIEADNLDALKLLQKAYAGRVKLIYIDPPYNTGEDRVYRDDFREPQNDYLQQTGQVDEIFQPLTTNTRTDGRFHSNWLNMIFPRLLAARLMMRDDGVIFVSIDDNEVHNLRQVMDEVFGAENFIGIISWRNVTDNNPTLINKDNEFVLCYGRRKAALPQAWRSSQSETKTLLEQEYARLSALTTDTDEIQRGIREFIRDNFESLGNLTRYKFVDEEGVYTGSESVHNPRAGGYDFEVLHPITKRPMRKPANGYRFPEATFREMEAQGLILYGEHENQIVKIKKYLRDFDDVLRSVITLDGRLGAYDIRRLFDTEEKLFDNPKPVQLLSSLFSFVMDRNDILLDFFAGSGTSAQSVMELNLLDSGNRRFILVQLPESTPPNSPARKAGYLRISSLSADRIRRTGRKIAGEKAGLLSDPDAAPLDLGFRFYRFAPSNYKAWEDYDGEDVAALQASFDQFETPLIDGWQPAHLLTEVMLHLGFPLDSRIVALPNFTANTVQHVTSDFHAHSLFACFDATIADETIAALALGAEDIFVCLDSALTDQTKARLSDVCNLRTI